MNKAGTHCQESETLAGNRGGLQLAAFLEGRLYTDRPCLDLDEHSQNMVKRTDGASGTGTEPAYWRYNNSFDKPARAAPFPGTVETAGDHFSYQFPPNSLTIIRVPSK